MTPIEYLKDLIKICKEAFTKIPSENSEVESFRNGMICAWDIAICGLEHLDD